MKKCSRCKKEKDDSLFYVNYFYCKECSREYEKQRTIKKGSLYTKWRGMRGRCYDANNRNYHNYGERGIAICSEWYLSFKSFETWALVHGYKEGLTIDRINPDVGYEPGNCRFITRAENNRTKRSIKLSIEIARDIRCRLAKGEQQISIARFYSIAASTVREIKNNQIWRE